MKAWGARLSCYCLTRVNLCRIRIACAPIDNTILNRIGLAITLVAFNVFFKSIWDLKMSLGKLAIAPIFETCRMRPFLAACGLNSKLKIFKSYAKWTRFLFGLHVKKNRTNHHYHIWNIQSDPSHHLLHLHLVPSFIFYLTHYFLLMYAL